MNDGHDTSAPGPTNPPAPSGAPERRPSTELPTFPGPNVSVKTNVTMHYKSIDADGKVTTVDVDPRAAKRLFYGGIALLIVSVLLIFAATLFLAAHFWPK